MADFHKYIEPQKQYADLLIRYFDKNLTDYTVEKYKPHLSLKITAVNEVNFEPLVEELKKYGINVTYEFNENMTYQSLIFDGADFEQNTIPVTKIAWLVVPELEYILSHPIVSKNDMWSIIGLVILMMINKRTNYVQGNNL